MRSDTPCFCRSSLCSKRASFANPGYSSIRSADIYWSFWDCCKLVWILSLCRVRNVMFEVSRVKVSRYLGSRDNLVGLFAGSGIWTRFFHWAPVRESKFNQLLKEVKFGPLKCRFKFSTLYHGTWGSLKLLQKQTLGVIEILSTHFKNQTQRFAVILSNYFKTKTQVVPEML